MKILTVFPLETGCPGYPRIRCCRTRQVGHYKNMIQFAYPVLTFLDARRATIVSFDEISVLLRDAPCSRIFQQILISYINLIVMEMFTQ